MLNKIKCMVISVTAILVYCYTPVKAQDSINKRVPLIWDLKSCVEYARKNNISINSLRLTSKSDEQNLILSQAARYPNLTGSVSQSIINYNSGVTPSSGYGVSSSVTLYNGGYFKNDIKAKQLSLQAAGLNVLASENDITLQITQAYLNILLARENIVYQQDVVNTLQAQVVQGQQRLDAGTIAKKDLLELQAVLASDHYNLISEQNTKRQNILILKQLLQLPSETTFDVSAADTVVANTLIASLPEAQQIALQNRPEVKSSVLGEQIAELGIEKARVGLRPSLSAGGSINSSYSKDRTDKYFSQLNNNFYQQLGLSLSVPLLDRKTTQTNVALAKIEREQAKLTLLNTKTILSQSIEQAYINVQNAQSQHDAAAEQLIYTREAYRIANEQLKIGVYNTVDYLQQKNLYVQALQAFAQSKYAVLLYIKIYNFYIGVPVTE
jgi:outer membrane protein